METFLHHYVEILSDPAHLAVEVTLMVLVDFVFLGAILPFVKRAVRRHDDTVHDTTDIAFRPDVEDVRSELLDIIDDLRRDIQDLQDHDLEGV